MAESDVIKVESVLGISRCSSIDSLLDLVAKSLWVSRIPWSHSHLIYAICEFLLSKVADPCPVTFYIYVLHICRYYPSLVGHALDNFY